MYQHLPKLPCMSSHSDGAKWGPSDWYDEIRDGIVEALAKGAEHEWTTGWYGCKKEPISARVSCSGGHIHIEVSMSDDLDTEGSAHDHIPFTTDVDHIAECIDLLLGDANQDQVDNRLYAGYSVHSLVPANSYYNEFGEGVGEKFMTPAWVETLLLPIGDGHLLDEPPGDNYHRWGWQRESKIPKEVRKQLRHWAQKHAAGKISEPEFTVDVWTIKPWAG